MYRAAQRVGVITGGIRRGSGASHFTAWRQESTQTAHSGRWEVVIGIEVHAQLRTQHKLLSHTPLFRPDLSDSAQPAPRPLSSDPNQFVQFEQVHNPQDDLAGPNRLVGYCDGGLPGALPSR